MVQRVSTVAFEGIEARAVDVQVRRAGPAGLCKGWTSMTIFAAAAPRFRSPPRNRTLL